MMSMQSKYTTLSSIVNVLKALDVFYMWVPIMSQPLDHMEKVILVNITQIQVFKLCIWVTDIIVYLITGKRMFHHMLFSMDFTAIVNTIMAVIVIGVDHFNTYRLLLCVLQTSVIHSYINMLHSNVMM